jgi:hypothetical protein
MTIDQSNTLLAAIRETLLADDLELHLDCPGGTAVHLSLRHAYSGRTLKDDAGFVRTWKGPTLAAATQAMLRDLIQIAFPKTSQLPVSITAANVGQFRKQALHKQPA